MIVEAKLLPQTPIGFQKYVEKYFFEQMLFGRLCFIAFLVTTIDEESYTRIRRGFDRGTAPARIHELDIFDPNLFKWIKKHANTTPGLYLIDHDWTTSS